MSAWVRWLQRVGGDLWRIARRASDGLARSLERGVAWIQRERARRAAAEAIARSPARRAVLIQEVRFLDALRVAQEGTRERR